MPESAQARQFYLHVLPLPGTEDPFAVAGTLTPEAAREWLDDAFFWSGWTSLSDAYTDASARTVPSWDAVDAFGLLASDVTTLTAAAGRAASEGRAVSIARDTGSTESDVDRDLALIVGAFADGHAACDDKFPRPGPGDLLAFLTARLKASGAGALGQEVAS